MKHSARSLDDVLSELDVVVRTDPDVHGNHLFGLVYPTGRRDLERLIHEVYDRFLFTNALNPIKFAEVARIERIVIDAAASLVHHPGSERAPGSMTSGGTESILMSMLVNRERARRRGVERPAILAPASAHPAYAKAAHYFDMDYARIPLDENYRADPVAARALVTDSTAVIVANAYSYPHGAMDPVTELAAIAAERGVACHVDACIGGFILPFLEMNGRSIPPWDFRVEGVTEISMDAHKYAYVPKGSSVILHRDDDWGWLQTFFYDEWGSGLYATPAIMGARPAAPAMATWAVMEHLGTEGFCEIAGELMATADSFRAGVAEIPGLSIVGDPVGPLFALTSDTIDLYAVGDVMDDRGWHLNRNTDPKGLHLMLSPGHRLVIDALLSDLAVATVSHGESLNKPVRYS